MVLAGCGSTSSSFADTSDDGKLMTVQFYNQLANEAGVMKGWFPRYIQRKFNIKINLISPTAAGGGDSLFDTRSAAGDLGDIIVVDSTKLKKLVRSGLVADMSPYMKGMNNLNHFRRAANAVNKDLGKKSGVWAFPEQVSDDSPTTSSSVVDPDNAPYIRWDYYRAIGYPKMRNLDDYIKVMKQMQDYARKKTGQNDIYAMSLFKDWDDTTLRNASDIAGCFGYMQQDNILFKPEGTGYDTPLDKNGIYQKVLKFLYKCNQAGILDPESSTQDGTKRTQKIREGKVLTDLNSYSYWTQNIPSNMKKGQGMFVAPIEDLKVHTSGFQPRQYEHGDCSGLKGQEQAASRQVHQLHVFFRVCLWHGGTASSGFGL